MPTPPLISPLRARLAFKASRFLQETFVCRRCMQQQTRRPNSSLHTSIRDTEYLRAFRRPRQQHPQPRYQSSPSYRSNPTSPLSALSQTITAKPTHPRPSTKTSPSSWPEISHKSVAYWLLASATSVFGIVVFGGLTRLTESGLSITEWRPVTGSFPPRDEEAWEEEFARYKLSPEFKMLNSRMGLEEFKQIYWMEWTHRLWGRVVGVTFLVPTLWFVVRRRVSRVMAVKLVGICGLIGFQGVIGWWMVKSGLKDDLFEQGKHPRVSQYRLAAHLGTAFIAYLSMLWNGLSILREHRLLRNPASLAPLQTPTLLPFKRMLLALTLLTFLTALSGALVAGLDAGLVYNDFPWMGRPNFLPPKRELLDPFYSHQQPPNDTQQDLLWRNMLENPILAQLDHRLLATTTFLSILSLWAYSRFNPRVCAALPVEARKGMLAVVHLVSLQVMLGISTLWYLVPTPLAAAHQAGALALLSGVVVLGGRVWVSGRSVRLVERALARTRQR